MQVTIYQYLFLSKGVQFQLMEKTVWNLQPFGCFWIPVATISAHDPCYIKLIEDELQEDLEGHQFHSPLLQYLQMMTCCLVLPLWKGLFYYSLEIASVCAAHWIVDVQAPATCSRNTNSFPPPDCLTRTEANRKSGIFSHCDLQSYHFQQMSRPDKLQCS